jgi:hypothetical protein
VNFNLNLYNAFIGDLARSFRDKRSAAFGEIEPRNESTRPPLARWMFHYETLFPHEAFFRKSDPQVLPIEP